MPETVLIGGRWRSSIHSGTFRAEDPARREQLPEEYPVSSWADCDAALDAAAEASLWLQCEPAERIARFLEDYAARIEQLADRLVAAAHRETALPVSPRLRDVELPRTVNQLRQAAAAAREGSWSMPTIDTAQNIRSCFAAIGPVCVFGPNNFPFAFGSISGGDFAAALAAGNPVIAKSNTSHPGVTKIFAEAAQQAAEATELPPATVQLIYRTSHDDGKRLISDRRVGATAYTGSRAAGLALKAAADAAGKPIYLELSSINPVVFLPGALAERGDKIAEEFTGSCLMGAGQFCTNPGLIVVLASAATQDFLNDISRRFHAAPVGTLLSRSVAQSLERTVEQLRGAGAQVLTGSSPGSGAGHSFANTLLQVTGQQFVADAETLTSEAFGNVSLAVVASDVREACEVVACLEGNLTGAIYSSTGGADDEIYEQLEPLMRSRVGRLLNDKMPTGVAVSPAMNHGGPYPATGHPGFTAVGMPASLRRFAVLHCYDNVRPQRLPAMLRDKNPTGKTWRLVDGAWTQGDVAPSV